jgi:uncharacterized protein YbaP (TraB family)
MRQAPRVLAASLLLCLAALAQTAPAPARSTASRKAIFWKVTSPSSVLYLLGSIHLGSEDMYPLPKEIEDAFDGSAALLVEADVRNVDMAKTQAMVLQKGLYAPDDSLWNHVSPETKKHLEEFCAKYQMPAEMFARMKPWVVSIAIPTIPLLKAGMDPNLGIDMYFLKKADHKRIVEIESAQWQLDLLSGFPDDLQEKMLASAAQEGATMMDSLKHLQDAWSAGDADALDAAIRKDSTAPEQITKAVLYDRNPHMADAAEERLKGKEQSFMVVGAAHMVGKDGVAAILAKRGYKVEQVALKK